MKEITILTPLEDAADLAVSLSLVEGCDATLSPNAPVTEIAHVQTEGEKPTYSLGFAELVPVVVAIAGTATSALSLATAIVNFRKEKMKSKAESPVPLRVRLGKKELEISPSTTVIELAHEFETAGESKSPTA
jgi:hypothetical protein